MKILIFTIILFEIAFFSDVYALENKRDEIIFSWFISHNEYRLADISDCNCIDDIKDNINQLGKDYDPYKTEGDFDGDGKNDFSVIVVKKSDQKDFLILVFLSRFARGQNPLVYGNIFDGTLSGMGLFKSDINKKKSTLLFGAFGSEAEPIHVPIQLP